MSVSTRSVHRLVRSGLAFAVSASLLAFPVESSAITREEVIKRASRWSAKRIPYSQARYYDGYRTDCSGYVSMAWGLSDSLTTWTIPRVSHRISKGDLKPGDVLLNNDGGALRHVVIFGGWANKDKTAYIGYEENGPAGRALRRVIPYPFFFAKNKFKPYRFDGITDKPVARVDTRQYVHDVRGMDRYVTAVKASQSAYKKADAVVIASGEEWADALAASSLAGAVDGPLLLVRRDRVHGEVTAEIRRLGAKEIIVVGNGDSIDGNVVKHFSRLATTRRIGGANRYTTAAAVAAETVRRLDADPEKHYDGTVMVVSGRKPVDALAATPLASKNAWPILFSVPGELTSESRAAIGRIGVNRIVVLGGEDQLGARVARELDESTPGPVTRIKGQDRYATSVAVAEYASKNGLNLKDPAVATNATGTDGIAAGVAQGKRGSVLMVTRTDQLSLPVERTISNNSDEIGKVRAIGGTMHTGVKERIATRIGATPQKP